MFRQPCRNGCGIDELPGFRRAGECMRHAGDNGHRADDHQHDAQPQIDALVADEARRDALVDHIALLEKQLPRRDGGADNTDDEQHHVGQRCVGWHMRHHKVVQHVAHRRMHHDKQRNQQQAAQHQHHREALETAEVASAGSGHDEHCRHADSQQLGQAEEIQSQADADEFGDDGQRIQDKQVDHAEGTPEFAEAFQDQARMADAGDCAQAQHHFLIHIQDRDQQGQRPQQRGAVILPGLRVGAESAGIVVANHHDQARAEDGEQGLQARHQPLARPGVGAADGAERTTDIAEVGAVEYCGGLQVGHGFLPFFCFKRPFAELKRGAANIAICDRLQKVACPVSIQRCCNWFNKCGSTNARTSV